MSSVAVGSGRQTVVPDVERPVVPSWIDRFMAWVERLPGPWWAWYVGAARGGAAGLRLLASLSPEREMLGRRQTWPRQPGQIGAVISAIVEPIMLFVIRNLLAPHL